MEKEVGKGYLVLYFVFYGVEDMFYLFKQINLRIIVVYSIK